MIPLVVYHGPTGRGVPMSVDPTYFAAEGLRTGSMRWGENLTAS